MNKTERPPDRPQWRSILLGCLVVISVILVGWMLRAMAAVIVPIVFSIFLALIVAPVDQWGKRHAPEKLRWLGHLAAMGTILLVLLVFVGCIWIAAQQIVARFPVGSGEAADLLPSFSWQADDGAGTAFGSTQETADTNGMLSQVVQQFGSAGTSLADRVVGWAVGNAARVLDAAGTTLGAATLVFFLTLMMLIEAPRWQKKITALSSNRARHDAMQSTEIIASRLRRYLLVRTIIGILTALLYVLWLWIFGVDLLIVWGLLTFVLTYIPTLGSLISGILPVLYAIMQKDFGTVVAVGFGILAIEQVMGNYVDPRVQGRQVSLSALVVLIALLFWTWLWGIAGAFLAVPVTIAIAIVAAHVGPLRPLALLLSNETDAEGLDSMTSNASR